MSHMPLMNMVSDICGGNLRTTSKNIDSYIMMEWYWKKCRGILSYKLKWGMRINWLINAPFHHDFSEVALKLPKLDKIICGIFIWVPPMKIHNVVGWILSYTSFKLQDIRRNIGWNNGPSCCCIYNFGRYSDVYCHCMLLYPHWGCVLPL